MGADLAPAHLPLGRDDRGRDLVPELAGPRRIGAASQRVLELRRQRREIGEADRAGRALQGVRLANRRRSTTPRAEAESDSSSASSRSRIPGGALRRHGAGTPIATRAQVVLVERVQRTACSCAAATASARRIAPSFSYVREGNVLTVSSPTARSRGYLTVRGAGREQPQDVTLARAERRPPARARRVARVGRLAAGRHTPERGQGLLGRAALEDRSLRARLTCGVVEPGLGAGGDDHRRARVARLSQLADQLGAEAVGKALVDEQQVDAPPTEGNAAASVAVDASPATANSVPFSASRTHARTIASSSTTGTVVAAVVADPPRSG